MDQPQLPLLLLAPLLNLAILGSYLMLLVQQLTCCLLAVAALLQLWPGNFRPLLQLQTALLQLP